MFRWSMDGETWFPTSAPNDVFSYIVGGGSAEQVIYLPYTTTGQFGLKLRFAIYCGADAGSTSTESATVTAALAFEFKT